MALVKYVLVFAAIFGMASCDYKCLCNYNVEESVYSSPSLQGNVIGYMYEFDCKPLGGISSDVDWIKVAFENKLGYIKKDSQLQIQTCPGSVPDEDKLPTTSVPATTMSQTTEARTTMSTSTESQSTIEQTTRMDITTQNPTTPTTRTTTSRTVSTNVAITTEPTTVIKTSSTTPTTQVPTTKTMSSSTTSQKIVTTQQLNTSKPSILKGLVELCPHRIQQLASQSQGENLAQFRENCYEVNDTRVSWFHAETICKQHGGHLIHIANQEEQDFAFKYLVKNHTHAVWLGLNDRYAEEKFEWSSGDNVTYENWKFWRIDFRHHNAEDCVFMNPTSGKWDDIRCGGDNTFSELLQGIRLSYICQYAITTSHNQDGHIDMCSHPLRQQAQKDKGILAQNDRSCYELVPQAHVSWQGAKEICISRGGHLVYIESLQEQTFVQSFMKRYYPDHAVWIGLTDSQSEGRFQWASGSVATFTNWVPGSTTNFNSSIQEDCVVLIPYENGQWNDVPCGQTHHSFFGGASYSGETHPILCEYSTYTGPSFIG